MNGNLPPNVCFLETCDNLPHKPAEQFISVLQSRSPEGGGCFHWHTSMLLWGYRGTAVGHATPRSSKAPCGRFPGLLKNFKSIVSGFFCTGSCVFPHKCLWIRSYSCFFFFFWKEILLQICRASICWENHWSVLCGTNSVKYVLTTAPLHLYLSCQDNFYLPGKTGTT